MRGQHKKSEPGKTGRSDAIQHTEHCSLPTGTRALKPTAMSPPRVELEQGRKWVVENHVGNRDVVVDHTSVKQTVYIYGCRDSTIQVNRMTIG